MSLLPEVKEMTPLADGNLFHKFQRNAAFYLTIRHLPIAQFGDIWWPVRANKFIVEYECMMCLRYYSKDRNINNKKN